MRVCARGVADRVLIADSPWGPTIERWQHEGLPEGTDYRDCFGLDKVVFAGVDSGPQYPVAAGERCSSWGGA